MLESYHAVESHVSNLWKFSIFSRWLELRHLRPSDCLPPTRKTMKCMLVLHWQPFLVISCHSCSIVKLIKVYITELSCICSLFKSECIEKQCVVCICWVQGDSFSSWLMTFIHDCLLFLGGRFRHQIFVTIGLQVVRIQSCMSMLSEGVLDRESA